MNVDDTSTCPGCFSESEPATPKIQEIVDQVKPQLEEKEDETYEVFEAIEFRTQVVAGFNYLIKVSVSDSTDECVHLKVFHGLVDENVELELTAYETGKTKDDDLTDFD